MNYHNNSLILKLSLKWKKVISCLTLAIYLAQPSLAAAQVVVDGSASANKKPTVETAQNGVQVVQIAAPSAAGVSHNQYLQFNVDQQGLILNNSSGISKTQLAGYITGNTNLGRGSARIILNEVTGPERSYLNGYTEIAGQRADLIIANPNGIVGNGFGFINAGRAILTTGTPVFGGTGSLDAFRVTGGQISIEGAGMDAGTTDRADIISQAVSVNAGIWAKELNVVTGNNNVDINTLQTTKIIGSELQPQIAIDVGELGGMYANKIRLVGTEQGVGVNSRGTISSSGDLTLTNEGKIQISGKLSSMGNSMIIGTEDVSNNGTIYAHGNNTINTNGSLENTGIIAANQDVKLSGKTVSSTGAIAAGVSKDGEVSSKGNLSILAQESITNNGSVYAKDAVNLSADAILNQGQMEAAGAINISANNIENQTGAKINSNKTTLEANDKVSNGGRIEGDNVLVTGQSVTNTGLVIGNGITLSSKNLTNQGQSAIIAATGDINLWTKENLINKDKATITSLQDINIAADSQRDSSGKLVNRTQQVVNEASTIETERDINIAADKVENRADKVEIGTTTTSSSQVLTQKPSIFSWASTGVDENGNEIRITDDKTVNQGYYDPFKSTAWKLCVTVPKDDVISYDPTIKKIIFNDNNITTYKVVARVWRKSGFRGGKPPEYIKGPLNYPGKIPGQTSAYYVNVSVTDNGDYYVEYYPAYDPAKYIDPDTIRSVATNRTGNAQEVRRETTTTVTQEYISNQPNSGKINIGRNFNLNIGESFLNQYSSVSVGNNVQGFIGTLNNQGYQLHRTSQSIVQSRYYAPYGKGGTWGKTTDGPYQTVEDVEGGTPATFVAKTINVEGVNVSNIDQRPDGTPAPEVGSTLDKPTPPPGSSGSGNNSEIIKNVPQNGLYTVHPEASSKYLVETDPRFANFSNFISSDYMLERLSYNPEKDQKRLGDGFYEQKLVLDQITQLTGRRYLLGVDNAQEQFKQLMDAGLTASTELQLVPGVALTSAQMAALKNDIVWMVEQEIELPNGQKEKALVPVVYLSQASKLKLNSTGVLISADSVNMNLSGEIKNSGSISSSNSTSIKAGNIYNIGGDITGDNSITLNATNDIVNQSGRISGEQVGLAAGRDVINRTTSREISASGSGRYSWAVSNTVIGQKASIEAGEKLSITADRDISVDGAGITSKGDAVVEAGRNLEVNSIEAKSHAKDNGGYFRYERNSTTNVASTIQANHDLSLSSKGDTSVYGSNLKAGNDLTVSAQNNIYVGAVKDTVSNQQQASDRKRYYGNSSYDETVMGSNLTAGNNVSITAGNRQTGNADKGNINITGSNIVSEHGAVSVQADRDITVQETTERHESMSESRIKKRGVASSKTTSDKKQGMLEQVKGSTISGNQVGVSSGKEVQVKGSNIVATQDINLSAEENVTITSAQETSANEHYHSVKKSGILSGGGIGFTIGSQSQKTTLQAQNVTQVGSTIGTTDGKVNVDAGKDAHITASEVIGGQGINITGQNIDIDAALNTSKSKETYEFKQSGLSVSVGNTALDAFSSAAQKVSRSQNVQDDRLKALYEYKAIEDIKKGVNAVEDQVNANENPVKEREGLKVTVSVGSSSSKSETVTKVNQAQGSTLTSDKDINLTATGNGLKDETGSAVNGNVKIIGSSVTGENVNVTAAKDIDLLAADNSSITNTTSNSNSVGVGASFGPKTGIFIEGSKYNGNENQNGTTHTQTVVLGNDTLTTKSGSDTNIIGGQAKGSTVKIDAEGNLNIASQQDIETYNVKSSSSSATIGLNMGSTASASKSKTDSNYQSVTNQSGVYAGSGGFDINVGKNTDLTGAMIASTATPDKNTLSTGTLTFSDIQNKADYSASSIGANYNSNLQPGMKLGDLGLTPNIGVVVSGNADSTTKSAISNGTIIVGGTKVDPVNLSRDTNNSLNALGKIFDKQTVEERQELVSVFGEVAAEEIHKLSVSKGWKDGDPNKVALHTILGTLMAQMSGGNPLSGGFSAGLNEALQKELANLPSDVRQWASYVIGSAAAKLAGGTPQTGGSIAANGTKNNNAAVAVVAVYTIPGIGEVALLATGAIVVGGIIYEAGSWVYNKYVVYKFDKAVENGEPTDNHRVDDSGNDLPATGQPPNSSADKLNPDGSVKQRRYYGPDGRALEDIDYNHSNGDGTHTFPHRHSWDWSQYPPRQ